MPTSFTIRTATEADASQLLAIYRPFVETTPISFETVAPTVDEFAARIKKALSHWCWLVAESNGKCIGYAYASAHRERAAYRWSVDVAVYIRPENHRQGIGRALYRLLFDQLTNAGYCQAFAGITQPNESSVGLHRSLGFEPVGVYRAVGRKFGKWHDVAWLQLKLRDAPPHE